MKKWFLFIGLALFIGAFIGCKKEDPVEIDLYWDIGLDNKSSYTWKVEIQDYSDIILASYSYKSIKGGKGSYHNWSTYVWIGYGADSSWVETNRGQIGFTKDITLRISDSHDPYWE